MKKRLVICLLAVVLVLGLAVSAYAVDPLTVTGGDVSAKTGQIETGENAIAVPITVSNVAANVDKLTSIKVQVDWDENILEYTGKTNGDGDGTITWSGTNGAAVSINNTDGITTDFTLITLNFTVKNSVKSDTDMSNALKLTITGATNDGINMDLTTLVCNSPTITVTHTHSTAPADSEWTERTAASCTQEGEVYYVCTFCSDEISKPVAKLNHQLTKNAGTVPTCATEGTKDTWTCSSCGQTFLDEAATTLATDENKTIPVDPDNHEDLQYVTAQKATQNEDNSINFGWYEHMYCSACKMCYHATTETDGSHNIDTTQEAYGKVDDAGNKPDALLVKSLKVSGDVDDDGEITDADGVRLLRYLAGGFGDRGTVNALNADVDADGEITDADGVRLLRYLAGGFGDRGTLMD